MAHTWFGNWWSKIANKWLSFHHKHRVKVRIDPWDTWSMDDTLAHIILPMLVQLKETKHGAPNVDPKDVPKELHGKKLTKKQKDHGEVDDKHFERWDWVLDEMIWAFSEHVKDWDESEGQFHTGNIDIVSVPVDEAGNEVAKEDAKYFRLDRGPNDTSHFDKEGYEAWLDRKQNGFRLFGKYYTSLWN